MYELNIVTVWPVSDGIASRRCTASVRPGYYAREALACGPCNAGQLLQGGLHRVRLSRCSSASYPTWCTRAPGPLRSLCAARILATPAVSE